MPASLPPSALPSRQSPSRPADASSEFVVPEASPAEVKGSEPSAPAVGSGATMEESVESGEDFGTQEEHAPDTSSVGQAGDEKTAAPDAGGAKASPEPAPESLVGDSRPPATVHLVSNPLPELELVPQSDIERKAVATASNGKVTPRVNIAVARVDSAVLQQGEFGSNLAPTGTAAGSSAEAIRNPSSTSPNELGPRTPPPSDVSGSFEPDVGPRGPEVNTTGRAPEFPAGEVRPASNRPKASQAKLLPGDLPVADQGVVQVGSDATQPAHSERPEVSRAQTPVSAEEGSQRGEALQSSARPEGGSTAPSLIEPSTPVREVAGDPLRTAPQSSTPQPVQGNAPTQSVNFSGGLAEAVDAGAAEEVPVSVNLTRRALRSLGRGHGGATVVQLRPAQFGKVTVRVQMEEGRVQADLVARTPEAARVLGEHLRLLRDSLEHKGLVVDRLEVREESKVESSRLDQHNENDADEDRSGGKRDRQEGETSSKRSSPQVLGQLDERADEFGQVLMAAEEQA